MMLQADVCQQILTLHVFETFSDSPILQPWVMSCWRWSDSVGRIWWPQILVITSNHGSQKQIILGLCVRLHIKIQMQMKRINGLSDNTNLLDKTFFTCCQFILETDGLRNTTHFIIFLTVKRSSCIDQEEMGGERRERVNASNVYNSLWVTCQFSLR